MSSAADRPTGRRAAAALVAVLGLGGTAACGQDQATPDGVTAEQLRDVQDDVAALEERVAELEAARSSAPSSGETSAPPTPTATSSPTATPTPTFRAGDDVSFRGEVVDLVATTDIGTAVRVSTESGATVSVVSATPVADLDPGDVVQVTGTATRVQRSSFERDFGIAADVLLDDPDAFLAEEAGRLAVAADQVRLEGDGAD
ncbi:hypothetical protein [Modestobacter italicus]|uniref:hypothetical protein n=1 Tax=Modestobacter italicus (strain DSM 44449 / CECT 9708 / BC 501) TaxID=2732864 RepID=UPI001C98602A|nr:hypothetical protein [Modestobacter italicus]